MKPYSFKKFILVTVFLVIFLFPEPIAKLQHVIFHSTDKTMSITVLPEKNENSKANQVWIYSIKVNDIEVPLSNVQLSQGWEYREKIKFGYVTDCIVSTSPGSVLTLSNISSDTAIRFYTHIQSGKISVAIDGEENNQTYDLFSQSYSAFSLNIDTLVNSNITLELLFSLLMYIIVFFIIILLIYILKSTLIRKEFKFLFNILNNEANKLYYFIFFTVCIFLFIYIMYKEGIPNLIIIGDQGYYWNMGQNFFLNGRLSIHNYAQSAVTFRGYIMPLIFSTIQKICDLLGINAYLIYSAMVSMMFSSLYSVAIPLLYEGFSGKKTKNIQILVFAGLTSIFWCGYYIYVLLDFWALTFFLFALVFLFKAIKRKRNYLNLLLISGILVGLAILSRGNYVLALYCIIVYIVFSVWKDNYFTFNNEQRRLSLKDAFKSIEISFFKETSKKIIFFLIGMVVICFPQLLINMEKGQIGLFPYDTKGAWLTKDQTLTEFAVQTSFINIQGYPFSLQDEHSHSLVQAEFDQNHMSIVDYGGILLEKPVDMLAIYARKAFLFLDTKTFITYPEGHLGAMKERIFSMANYTVWIIFAWYMISLYHKTPKQREERFYVFLMSIALTLNYVIIQVEWRYFITLYMLAYYMIAYPLFDYFIEINIGKVLCIKNIIIFITLQLILYMISSTMYYNL